MTVQLIDFDLRVVVVYVVKCRLVFSALLGDDLLHCLWLDCFLVVFRQFTYLCKDGQSIDELVVNVRMNANTIPPVFLHTDGWCVLTCPRVQPT